MTQRTNKGCPIILQHARIYKSAEDQAVGDGATAEVVLDGSSHDNKQAQLVGGVDVAGNEIMITEAGYYLLHGKVQCTTDGTLDIYSDTTEIASSGVQAANAEVTTIQYLAAGVAISMKFTDVAGGSSLIKGSANTYLEVSQLMGG